jgi:sulfite oxidase
VYDITDYHAIHPGGHFILRAAGGSVEAWWEHWTYHHLSPKVAQHLENLRIGRLSDYVKEEEHLFDDELYEDEPGSKNEEGNFRDSRQHTLSSRPYCSETKNEALVKSHYTPNSAFYVRNHAPVPLSVDPSEHVIEFIRGGGTGRSDDESQCVETISVTELVKRFGSGRVTSVMQCAGNRANENIRMRGEYGEGYESTNR